MSKYQRKLASEVGIQAGYIKDQESCGLNYFTWHSSDTVGAQCSFCNMIVWLDSLENRILSEARPENIPASGNEYRDYYSTKLRKFLKSLPICPSCGKSSFDRFINNVNFPRYLDGTEVDVTKNKESFIRDDSRQHHIWWLED